MNRGTIETDAGTITVEVDDEGAVMSCLFKNDAVDSSDETPALRQVLDQLREYFSGGRKAFDLSLNLKGTEFQKTVWKSLQTIPFGETISYSELAKRVGSPKAVRAVGRANGANPIAVIVPCHRVIGSNGSLTGYAGGMERKRVLLMHEGVDCNENRRFDFEPGGAASS